MMNTIKFFKNKIINIVRTVKKYYFKYIFSQGNETIMKLISSSNELEKEGKDIVWKMYANVLDEIKELTSLMDKYIINIEKGNNINVNNVNKNSINKNNTNNKEYKKIQKLTKKINDELISFLFMLYYCKSIVYFSLFGIKEIKIGKLKQKSYEYLKEFYSNNNILKENNISVDSDKIHPARLLDLLLGETTKELMEKWS